MEKKTSMTTMTTKKNNAPHIEHKYPQAIRTEIVKERGLSSMWK